MSKELTITLDEELAAKLHDEARRTGVPLDEAAVDAVRRGLEASKPFRVRAFDMGEPLIDITCTARALDEADRLEERDHDPIIQTPCLSSTPTF
jgi:hypothetical protein